MIRVLDSADKGFVTMIINRENRGKEEQVDEKTNIFTKNSYLFKQNQMNIQLKNM